MEDKTLLGQQVGRQMQQSEEAGWKVIPAVIPLKEEGKTGRIEWDAYKNSPGRPDVCCLEPNS